MTGGRGVAPVLLAVTGRPYEEQLLAVLGGADSRVVVARRCLDVVDLLAAAAAGVHGPAVAVVSSTTHRLDRECLARLDAAGVRTVAVVEPESGADGARTMADLGAAAVVAAPAGPDARAVAAFAAEVASHVRAVHARSVHPAAGSTRAAQPLPLVPVQDVEGTGRLVVVFGPTGAPGRTSVAVTLADELARAGLPAALVDADTYGPSVAQRLGILDEASGLAAVTRAANAGVLDAAAWAAAARALGSGLRVLTGLTRPDRWPEALPAPALAAVWRQARRSPGVTVVDGGFCLEDDDEFAYDGVAVRRNAATLTSLAAADVVVVVGGADPVGLARLVRATHDLDDLARRRPGAAPVDLRVVVNRVRPGVLGRGRPEPALAQVLALGAGPGLTDPTLVRDDPEGFDRAAARGRTLAEAAPRSPARAALAALARDLGSQAAPAPPT